MQLVRFIANLFGPQPAAALAPVELDTRVQRQQLRAIDFLTESNAIEDIRGIDYGLPENQRCDYGHWGAYIQSQSMALRGENLSIERLCDWHRMITLESLDKGGVDIPKEGIGRLRSNKVAYDVKVGAHMGCAFSQVPQAVADLLSELNKELSELRRPLPAAETARLIGSYFQRFEAIHPFVDGNGRTGRLLANYIATRCGAPIIIIREAEARAKFYPAHRSKLLMACFMADKLREAVFGRGGEVYVRKDESYLSKSGKEMIVEWQELQEQVKRWQATNTLSA